MNFKEDIVNNPITPKEAAALKEVIASNDLKMTRKQHLRDLLVQAIADADGRTFDILIDNIMAQEFITLGYTVYNRFICHIAANKPPEVHRVLEAIVEDMKKHEVSVYKADASDELAKYEAGNGPLKPGLYTEVRECLEELLP